MSSTAERIAEAIASRRRAIGMTQADLATAMTAQGVKWARVSVSEIETNRRRVEYEALDILPSILGVSLFTLLYETKALASEPGLPCPHCGGRIGLKGY